MTVSLPVRAPSPGATLVVAAILLSAACATSSTDPATASPPSRTPAARASSAPPDPGGPPSAHLAADGGDAVTGQLGSYVWDQAGSDSPWLPGSPIAVGPGEPLTVDLDPPIDVVTWQARYVPAGSSGPAGGVLLGEGVGPPRFTAPGPGSWTLALQLGFGTGRTAAYAWRLDVP